MSAPPPFGFEQLVTEIMRGLADAVSDRPGESEAQRFARHQTAIFSAMAFLPRDGTETMLASQCVMLDHLMRDAIRDLLRGEQEPIKRRLRSQAAALGRLFLKFLAELRQLQARPAEQIAISSPPAEPATVKPVPPVITRPREAPSDGRVALVRQRGFQNWRTRRAVQPKKSASHRVKPALEPTGG